MTQLYARTQGGITDTSQYMAGDISRTVYWFHNDSKRMGDYSPFGTLLMNEQVKEDFSKDVVDYVFLHEVGHDQMGLIWRSIFWTVYLTSGLLFFAGISALPGTLWAAIESAPSIIMLPAYLIVAVGITIAAGLPLVLVSWIDETLAELFAISKISRIQYQSVLKELKEVSDTGYLHKIRLRFQYPPDALILWIAQRRGIGDEQKHPNELD